MISIPVEALSLSAELVNDATVLTSYTIRGIKPTVASFGKCTGHFTVGLVNPTATEEEVQAKLETMTVLSFKEAAEANAAKAGQSVSKAALDFFSEE